MESSLTNVPSMPSSFKLTSHSAPLDVSCAAQLTAVHPIRASEENYYKNQQNLNLQMLRTRQGLHAPLTIKMEEMAVKKVGRLPILRSSNASFDSLTGRDLMLDFTDFLGQPEHSELMRQPHALMEKLMGF